jgi:hypothetical protein
MMSGHAEQAGDADLFDLICLSPNRGCSGPPTREVVKTGLSVLSSVLVAVPALPARPRVPGDCPPRRFVRMETTSVLDSRFH